MQPTLPVATLMAASALATVGGLACAFLCHRAPASRRPPMLRAAAVAGLLGGVMVPGLGWTWDAGLPIWLGLCSVGGFAVTVAAASAVQDEAAAPRPRRTPGTGVASPPRIRTAGSRVAVALAASAAFSAAPTLCAGLWLPLAATDRAMLAVVLWPILWAAFGIYLFAADNRSRAWVGSTGVTAISAAAAVAGFLA